MLQHKLIWIVCLVAIAMPLGGVVYGDGPAAAKPAATTSPATKLAKTDAKASDLQAAMETVDQLIEQLDSADFTKREAASGKLASKGKEAVPALEKTSAKGDLEASSRALSVLGKLLKSSDGKTSKAAEEALNRLADGDSPAAARRAKSVLDKHNGVENRGPFPQNGGLNLPMPGGGFGGGRIIINGGMLQLGGGAGMKTLSVTNNNGVREIKATEGDKTVKIDDDPASGIKIECTDKINGKQVTKKYEAKNVDELKKKQPEGYKLYKECGEQQQGNLGAIQLQIQGNLQPGLPAIPLQPAIPAPKAVPAPANGVQLDTAAMRLKVISAQLDSLRKNESLKNAPAEKKAELKRQIDELQQHMEELRKELDRK